MLANHWRCVHARSQLTRLPRTVLPMERVQEAECRSVVGLQLACCHPAWHGAAGMVLEALCIAVPDAVPAFAVSLVALVLSVRLGWTSSFGVGVSSLLVAPNALCLQVWSRLAIILFPSWGGTSYLNATVASSCSLALRFPPWSQWKDHASLFCSPATNGGISCGEVIT